MRPSHALDAWLASHRAALADAGVTAVTGRTPLFAEPSATWISLETPDASARLVLWSSGRCQLDAATGDGTRRYRTERTVAGSAELDDALAELTGHLHPTLQA